jgi:hypothetical protein
MVWDIPVLISKVDVSDGSLKGKHLVITCLLTIHDRVIQMNALMDCGAMGIAFTDQDFARYYMIPFQEFKEKQHVEVIDGQPIESGVITHKGKMEMEIQDHKEYIPMFVTILEHNTIFLEITWL